MNRYILLAIWLLSSLSVKARDGFDYERLPTEQKNWVDSVMASYSFSEKMSQLFWFEASVPMEVSAGGLWVADPQELASTEVPQGVPSYKILNLTDGYSEGDGAIAFPNSLIRASAQAPIFKDLQLLYDFDFWFDFSPESDRAVFYVVTLVGNRAVLTLFEHQDSLLQALVDFDQILWIGDDLNLDEHLNKRRLNRKTNKLLMNKAKDALALKKIKIDEKRFKQASLVFNHMAYEKWKWDAYLSGITLRNQQGKVPIKALDNTSICTFRFAGSGFDTFLESLSHYQAMPDYTYSDDLSKDRNRLKNYDYVIVPIEKWDAQQQDYLQSLNISNNLVLVNFDLENSQKQPQELFTIIDVWQHNELTESLTAQLIFGAYGFQGTWPLNESVNIKVDFTEPLSRLSFTPPHIASMDIQVLDNIDEVVAEAINEEAFPGCQILIAKSGKVIYHKNFGHYTYDSARMVDENTLYDLASLTKVLSTTQAVMILEERDLIDLDEPLSAYLPILKGSNKEALTIREIMAHQAGLFPYLPFWANTMKAAMTENSLLHSPDSGLFQIGQNSYLNPELADSILSWSVESELIEKEDESLPYDYKYSDIGFYLLKAMVEKIINQPIDQFMDKNIYGP